MERIKKNSLVTIEKQGRIPLVAATMVDGLSQIRDTDWGHIDPIKTLTKMASLSHQQVLNGTLIQSSIVEASMIPFTVPFPELCLEVAKYCNIEERTLSDTEGTQIMDFSMEGIEKAFAWSNKGIIFTIADSVQVHNNMRKLGNMV